MIFGQPIDVMIEGIEGRGRKNAGLSHAAAEQFPVPDGFPDQVAGTRQGRSHGCAEALAEADVHRIEVLRPLGR